MLSQVSGGSPDIGCLYGVLSHLVSMGDDDCLWMSYRSQAVCAHMLSYQNAVWHAELVTDNATYVTVHAVYQVEIVRSSSSRDSIGEAICKASDRLRASIIIVPGHRKTGLVDRIFKPEDHAAFGTYVASHSGRPTLIYQPPVEDNILMEQQSSSQQPVSRPSEVGLQMPV